MCERIVAPSLEMSVVLSALTTSLSTPRGPRLVRMESATAWSGGESAIVDRVDSGYNRHRIHTDTTNKRTLAATMLEVRTSLPFVLSCSVSPVE